jgi:hypothetical protein
MEIVLPMYSKIFLGEEPIKPFQIKSQLYRGCKYDLEKGYLSIFILL